MKRKFSSLQQSTSSNSTPLGSAPPAYLSNTTTSNKSLSSANNTMYAKKGRGGGSAKGANRNTTKKPRLASTATIPLAPLPLHDETYLKGLWNTTLGGRGSPNPKWWENSKGIIANYVTTLGEKVGYRVGPARVGTFTGFRATINADPNPPPIVNFNQPSLPPVVSPIIGTGDGKTAKEAEKHAAYHACLQLGARNLFTSSNLPLPARAQLGKVKTDMQNGTKGNNKEGSGGKFPTVIGLPGGNDGRTVGLTNGARIALEEARAFMDYYCTRYKFERPDLRYTSTSGGGRGRGKGGDSWCATLLVAGRRIGSGEAQSKKGATDRAYLDTAAYLESCDAELWTAWCAKKNSQAMLKGGLPVHVVFEVDAQTDEELRDTVYESRESSLYKRARVMIEAEKEKKRLKAEAGGVATTSSTNDESNGRRNNSRFKGEGYLQKKSEELALRLRNYQTDPKVERMRTQRATLPVASHASSVLAKIANSSVVVVLAATGSGKTTQVPQLVLDDWILRGEGAKCNIVCTQPRRIAAISVAQRVAAERGEKVGESVGYQVRFESKPPKSDGSILFCTTGLFLRRLQADLGRTGNDGFLDGVTHVVVDEVHERDVDTDLLLFVLRRLLHERRKAGKAEIRVILMSATIDPVLFTTYFKDPDTGLLAPVIEVPGRSFPVDKHFLDETVKDLQALRLPPNRGGWVWSEKDVVNYLQRELVPRIEMDVRTGRPIGDIDDLPYPFPLVALTIASVLDKSEEGHVLVFLPGWEEIQAVRNILLDRRRYPLFDIDFTDKTTYEIHVLHSTIPIAEQQLVFEPAGPGIRRIVLSTNIAETSVTIPDVVYVVDSAKCKEKRYDPERRLSQLVSAWTGTSNVLQRAGRAGRHRPGEYYGMVSTSRFAAMDILQTVEMLRTDLANTCMHITGLQLPISVEEVLASTIQPPERARVHAAMMSLKMVGAIDKEEKLTSLGRVLLQLPVEAAIGKLCLLGSFFRCLEQTLTLAAILTNRDPFLSPPLLKQEADRVKNSWTPNEFRSDPLAILSAFNVWWEMQNRGDFNAANRFCGENFLSKPTLMMIQKIKEHILQSLDKAGVLRISAGGNAMDNTPQGFRRGGLAAIPASLNVNGESLPLLSALIATAVAPNFAIRTSEKSFSTSQDKTCAIHPSSVNSRKSEKAADLAVAAQTSLYAYAEKSKTGGTNGKGDGQMFLRGTTQLDPLGFILFGAFDCRISESGLMCDDWLPVVGNVSALDDVERLKDVLDLSLLRVFESLGGTIGRQQQQLHRRPIQSSRRDEEEEAEGDEEVMNLSDPALSGAEVKDLDVLTTSVVRLLNMYADGRGSPSQPATRSATPSHHPSSQLLSRLGPKYAGGSGGGLKPMTSVSMPVTPLQHSPFSTRPNSAQGSHGVSHGGGGGGGSRSNWRN